jgi:hypothetical protein
MLAGVGVTRLWKMLECVLMKRLGVRVVWYLDVWQRAGIIRGIIRGIISHKPCCCCDTSHVASHTVPDTVLRIHHTV